MFFDFLETCWNGAKLEPTTWCRRPRGMTFPEYSQQLYFLQSPVPSQICSLVTHRLLVYAGELVNLTVITPSRDGFWQQKKEETGDICLRPSLARSILRCSVEALFREKDKVKIIYDSAEKDCLLIVRPLLKLSSQSLDSFTKSLSLLARSRPPMAYSNMSLPPSTMLKSAIASADITYLAADTTSYDDNKTASHVRDLHPSLLPPWQLHADPLTMRFLITR
ncbi:hypothetical protein K449DRAFT_394820 [Hypoxylon sp. EC38]|nr:hypothetical protein K449DRAFT_394820 [Hypoxylon sp. EC38]